MSWLLVLVSFLQPLRIQQKNLWETLQNTPVRFPATPMADWTWTPSGPEGGLVTGIAVDPVNRNLAYAVTPAAVWVTHDGASWSPHPITGPFNPQNFQVTTTGPEQALLAGEDGLVWRTSDGGGTWDPILSFSATAVLEEDPDSVTYLILDDLLLKSRDGGATWDTIGAVPFIPAALAHAPSDASILYATGLDSTFTPAAFKSTDGGQTWISLADTLIISLYRDIEIHPTNPDEVFLSPGGATLLETDVGQLILHTRNGGSTWTPFLEPLTYGIILPGDLEFSDTNRILLSSFFVPGLFEGTRLFGFWTFTPLDESANHLSIALGPAWYAGTAAGVMKSSNQGGFWFFVNSGMYGHLLFYLGDISDLISDRLIFAPGLGGGVYRTFDGGLSWDYRFVPSLLVVFSADIAPSDPNTVYLSGAGVEISLPDIYFHSLYRSTDAGNTFTPMDTTLGDTTGPPFLIYDLWVSPDDPNLLVGQALADSLTHIIRSTDGGHSWDTVQTYPQVAGLLEGIGPLYLNTLTGLMKSQDQGLTWTPTGILTFGLYSQNPADRKLYIAEATELKVLDTLGNLTTSSLPETLDLAFVEGGNAPGHVYVAGVTFDGYPLFLRSPDEGNTFEADTLPDFVGAQPRIGDGYVLLSTLGNSFMRSTDAAITVAEPGPTAGGSLRVLSPSIFGEHLILWFTAPLQGAATVRLYDVTGREVLRRRWAQVKGDRLIVPTATLPAGLYFLQVEAPGLSYRAKSLRLR